MDLDNNRSQLFAGLGMCDSDSRPGAESAGVNAILPGMKVDCVIGLCRVLDFGTATEVGHVACRAFPCHGEGKAFLAPCARCCRVAS